MRLVLQFRTTTLMALPGGIAIVRHEWMPALTENQKEFGHMQS